MSDYLRNLVSRSLMSAEVIQPRLASIYEPSASSDHIANDEFHLERLSIHTDHTLDQKASSSKPLESNSQQSLSQQLPSATLQTTLNHTLTADTVIPPILSEKNANDLDLTSTLSEQESGPMHKKTSPPSALNDEKIKIQTASFIENKSVSLSSEIPSQLNLVNETDNIDHNLSTSGIKEDQENTFKLNHKPTIQPVNKMPTPVGNQSQDTPKLVTTQPANLDNKPEKFMADTMSHEPEPVIRVTIGRVDVRAVTPPPPPVQQKARQSNPTLSLDDYLRKRNGGDL